MSIIERLESNVRSYCRSFPTTFARAQGSWLEDSDGRRYLDFFAGAGVLNYGHNPAPLQERLVEYIQHGGVTHALDMTTEAKCALLEGMERLLFEPRGLNYKVMFPGPTGTNAVEAALKLARKVTGRTHVVAFTNGFHGMTLGSLALTGNRSKRAGAGVPLNHVTRAAFDGFYGSEVDTMDMLEQLLRDGSSGLEPPAGFVLETVQAEGGINVVSKQWMQRLAALARRYDALLIVDDIQVGCGRTGPFFSFETLGVKPDIVCLSKSMSGYGLPLSLTLMRPELDVWDPGEHNGTFRGFNLAFVTALAALEHFWQDSTLTEQTQKKASIVSERLRQLARRFDGSWRGRGLIQGVAFDDVEIAGAISAEAFKRNLIVETAGPDDEVLKLLPPLTVTESELQQGLDVIEEATAAVCNRRGPSALEAVA